MRILHTNAGYWPFVGGAETYLRAISERLARDGHEVVVGATDATSVQSYWDPRQPRISQTEEAVGGVHVIRSRLAHLPLSPWTFYLLRRLATELARLPIDAQPLLDRLAPLMPWVPGMRRNLGALELAFDLVHGVNIALEWPLLAGWQYARQHGLPFVATPFLHVGDRVVQRFYTMPHQLAALRGADRVLVQTGIEARELMRLSVRQEAIVRLGMGVDLDEMRGGSRERFCAQFGIEGPVVTFMGVLTDDKGVVHLMRAMERLWQAGTPVTLVLAGPAIKPSSVERVYDSLPEEQRVHTRRLGPVAGQMKQDLLAATDIFALPSRVDSFGIVYLEAWAYEVPVIGCRAGGVPDVIDHGLDGLLVDFGDAGALADAIGTLLAAPEQRQAMGRRGRAKVEAHYTWDHIYAKLLSIYEELVG